MERRDSQIIKGIAILMMLFLHLFNRMNNVELCQPWVWIGGEPLVYILRQAFNPVSFFLIVGGYGLYKSYEKGDRNRYSRVFKLYVHYWIIFLIFVGIGCFIKPDVFPCGLFDFLSNITCYHNTINHEMWFMLPYVGLSLLAPIIFRFYSRFNFLTILLVTLALYSILTQVILSNLKWFYAHYWVYNPTLVLHLLYFFSLGALAARAHIFERLRRWVDKRVQARGEESAVRRRLLAGVLAWSAIIALIIINCHWEYNYFYAFGIISCILVAPMPEIVKGTLALLGKHSMNMWMIHSWWCYYLFRDFTYSFRYPLIIFLMLVAISLICS
ncbi:MAG: acyltransferase, partial [Muribaculaceae bacterium]|nr:acyltransferase [Muribaculaceae bacterium]